MALSDVADRAHRAKGVVAIGDYAVVDAAAAGNGVTERAHARNSVVLSNATAHASDRAAAGDTAAGCEVAAHADDRTAAASYAQIASGRIGTATVRHAYRRVAQRCLVAVEHADSAHAYSRHAVGSVGRGRHASADVTHTSADASCKRKRACRQRGAKNNPSYLVLVATHASTPKFFYSVWSIASYRKTAQPS